MEGTRTLKDLCFSSENPPYTAFKNRNCSGVVRPRGVWWRKERCHQTQSQLSTHFPVRQEGDQKSTSPSCENWILLRVRIIEKERKKNGLYWIYIIVLKIPRET